MDTVARRDELIRSLASRMGFIVVPDDSKELLGALFSVNFDTKIDRDEFLNELWELGVLDAQTHEHPEIVLRIKELNPHAIMLEIFGLYLLVDYGTEEEIKQQIPQSLVKLAETLMGAKDIL